MKSILAELWYGNILPQESGLCNTPEIKSLLQKEKEQYTRLEDSLTADQKKLLADMLQTRNEMTGLSETAIFTCGFRLGAKLMLDVLSEAESR